MPLVAVVAYPVIDEADRAWIESVRAQHDPLASAIGLHFTLVFPAAVSAAVVTADAGRAAAESPSVPFTLRRATAVRDVMGAGGHVFLVPDQGAEEIRRLHEQLYRGVLQAHRRADLPFVPHITVGAFADFPRCESLARQLNAEGRIISGTLGSIDLIDAAARPVASLQRFRLGRQVK